MKKVLFALAILIASTLAAHAQIAPVRESREALPPEVLAQNTQYMDLLAYQNHLLKNRKTALIVSLAGAGTVTVSTILGFVGATYSYNTNTGGTDIEFPAFATVGQLAGSVAATTGAVWYLVNEFKMIDAQKRINNHLILRYGPDGVKLMF